MYNVFKSAVIIIVTNIIINYNTANLCSSVPYESCVNSLDSLIHL